MSTTLTVKGQVTIPKPIRDALDLTPGTAIDFAVNREGQVVLQKVASTKTRKPQLDVQGGFVHLASQVFAIGYRQRGAIQHGRCRAAGGAAYLASELGA